MTVKVILENELGIIESYQKNFKEVFRIIAHRWPYEHKNIVNNIPTLSEARKTLWSESCESGVLDTKHTLHWYKWGDEEDGKVSAWIDFHNGDWMSIGQLHECIIGSEDWTKRCPYS